MDDYTRGGHTKYSLVVHLIFVTKYRKKILFGCFNDDVKQSLISISKMNDYEIIQLETDQDHAHILLKYSVNTSISSIAKKLKQYSTFILWKKYEKYLSKYYWKRHVLWSEGYFACSVGQASQKTIEKYIMSQG